jgi:hypothetical protein
MGIGTMGLSVKCRHCAAVLDGLAEYEAHARAEHDHAPRYLGQSAIAGGAMTCDRCGAHWYPDMGERSPAVCIATPDWLRAHPKGGIA